MNRLSATVKRIKEESPCTLCKYGNTCENKNCFKWRKWFTKEWQKFNNYYNKNKPETVERCVCCGEVIPEGKQVCAICERSITL